MLCAPIKIKNEALHYFKIYKAKVENQLERKIKRLRSDHGGEYFSSEFSEFCVEHGIIHERTPPYSPQSIGIAERKNHTLTELVSAMLEQQDYLRNGGIRLTTREQNLENLLEKYSPPRSDLNHFTFLSS